MCLNVTAFDIVLNKLGYIVFNTAFESRFAVKCHGNDMIKWLSLLSSLVLLW